MKVVAICQARMGSTRLPGKVLMDIEGIPTVGWAVRAAQNAPGVDQVLVATSIEPQDDKIVDWCKTTGVGFFRGSENDVISRYLGAAEYTNADIIVRLTSDCPFLDANIIGETIKLREMKGVDYATNTDPPTYPDGLDVEVFTVDALKRAASAATRGSDRDTVTRYMVRNRLEFSAANLVCGLPDLVRERWVVDSPEDLVFIREIARHLNGDAPSLLKILSILQKNPHLRDINSKYFRNERFIESLVAEGESEKRYDNSKACLDRAERTIPLGAQTFSKSKLQLPVGAAPLFVTHGDGGYVFDVDGNDYVDLVGGLLPNILGYRDPDVDAAIRDQLNSGISFSLASPIEADLAERLVEHIPSAEMVRFGKNGSDVTSPAIRLARHITGNNTIFIAKKGYHGWHDWALAGTERDAGIIGQGYSYRTEYLVEDTEKYDRIGAIIIEPEGYSHKELTEIHAAAKKTGGLVIFDEIISGFRCGMGGLQGVTGVTPDLSTFGKAMANGMPISALVGKREYMERMTEISYSGTFFGETLSIAAAIATIDKLHREDVPRKLNVLGAYIRGEVNAMLDRYSEARIKLFGEVELNRIKFDDKTIQSLFIQEMAKNGVLIIGSHNTSFAHKKTEIDRVLNAWDMSLKAISEGVKLEGKLVQGKAVR